MTTPTTEGRTRLPAGRCSTPRTAGDGAAQHPHQAGHGRAAAHPGRRGLPFVLVDQDLQAARHRVRHRDRRDRARPGHRVRRAGVARPRVLPRRRGLHRGRHQRRPGRRTLGFGIQEILIWLPAAGIVAGSRRRGDRRPAGHPAARALPGHRHARVWSSSASTSSASGREVTGGTGIGRAAPMPALFGDRLDVTGPDRSPRTRSCTG